MTPHSDMAFVNDPRRSLKVAIIALTALTMLPPAQPCGQEPRRGDRVRRYRDREPLMPTSETFSVPHDADDGYLELRRAGTHITIRAGGNDALCRAWFERVTPRAVVRGGRVSIEYPRLSLAGLFRHPAHRAEIELSPTLPWSIAVHGGLGDSSVDLRGLELRDFQLAGGASVLRLMLPIARGTVLVRIEGGATKLTLLRPRGVEAVLRILGGGSRLAFDGERYGSIGAETRLETANADSVQDRYEIEIAGGASELTISEHDGGDG